MRNTTVYIDKVQFSNRLKELFDTTEVKAVALENALGVGRATVSRWRNGHTLPDRSQVKEIADFFGVRYEWLVGSDEYKTVRDIPLKALTAQVIKKWKYFETLGYSIEDGKVRYEEDEDGDLYPIADTWYITRDGVKAEITDTELRSIEKEIESFIEYKMTQVFSK